MRVGFLCPSISRTSGGIFEIERRLALALSHLPAVTVEVFGPSDEYTQEDLCAWLPLEPRHFAYRGPSSFRYSLGLQKALQAADVDLVHSHALWMYNSVVIRNWVRLWKRPYLITANGMLEQWALRNSAWKKRIAWSLYEGKCLKDAACIQVNSEAESRSVRALDLLNPVCIIPNGVELPANEPAGQSSEDDDAPWKKTCFQGKKVLLYLGRLHPKKGLANLLKAWALVHAGSSSGWILAIAGWDQESHEAELQRLASTMRLLPSVVFLGPAFGRTKDTCYRHCNAFVLPSFSEGLPIAVLEAWSYGKPVLMTNECNLPQGFAARAAIRIEPAVESIGQGLKTLFEMSDFEKTRMGEMGFSLVKECFTWPRIAQEMRAVYAWMLGDGPKPACVIT